MYINPALIADLHELAAPLDIDDSDLSGFIQLLGGAAELSTPSLLGWRLSITLQDQPLTLTSIHPRVSSADVRASLRISLKALPRLHTEGFLVLFASQPDAFAVFAADVSEALHVSALAFQLDGDLEPMLVSGITGLREGSFTNQAIGVLLDSGYTISEARARVLQQESVTDLNVYRKRKDTMSNF